MLEDSVFIKTLGCKVNTYDSHALENQFRKSGYRIVDTPEEARVTVINTCSVTENASKEARYYLRKFHKVNPDSLRVVTGCYAQIDSAKLAELQEVDFVVPNEAKELLVELVHEGLKTPKQLKQLANKLPEGVGEVSNNRQSHFKSSLTLFDQATSEQTRAFIKVQDGCNGFCSYCQIPYARGSSRSVAPQLVLDEIKRLVDAGSKEIVFAGIHIGDYGEDLDYYKTMKVPPIVDLIEKTIQIAGASRIRISSLEPAEFSEPLGELMRSHRNVFCDHFHFPLQSGSNRILKLMNRKYDTDRYQESVFRAREIFPNAFIGCDIIPGFPGETEADFTETMKFVEHIQLTSLHVFPYSKRPNTAAIKMPDHLDPEVIKERSKIMREWSTKSLQKFYTKFIGQTLDVLWENDFDKEGRILGKSTNYLNIASPTSHHGLIPGSRSQVSIKGFLGHEKLLGVPLVSSESRH